MYVCVCVYVYIYIYIYQVYPQDIPQWVLALWRPQFMSSASMIVSRLQFPEISDKNRWDIDRIWFFIISMLELLKSNTGGSENGGTPIAGWFIRNNPIYKWMMTGGTPFWANPYRFWKLQIGGSTRRCPSRLRDLIPLKFTLKTQLLWMDQK